MLVTKYKHENLNTIKNFQTCFEHYFKNIKKSFKHALNIFEHRIKKKTFKHSLLGTDRLSETCR